MLVPTQRKGLLRLACAYRTVSSAKVQAIVGIPPIDLLVEERTAIHDSDPEQALELRRRLARIRTLEEWKRRWEENADTSQWTRTIISDLEAWVIFPHRRAEYFLTQFLSGHGSFNSYLCRIGRKKSDVCEQCQESDMPEHVMVHCPQFADNKLRVETRIGIRITPTNLMGQMIRSKDNWDKFITGYERS
ncbi:hypothetical protein NQ315_008928 [Exocentrus adspersus]|uniref:Reverse transcriptase zinc-binding domain-containing protein n=1 Tax=Exocentrus adspersus TaxID=1586481 RepID=A0AAV8V7L3_9CUCU|nr:hypothetical protein NQ315_008928 [Exocentrus adspersus]